MPEFSASILLGMFEKHIHTQHEEQPTQLKMKQMTHKNS